MLAAACSDGEPDLAPSTTADLAAVVVTTEAPAVTLTLPVVEAPRVRAGLVRVGIWLEPEPDAPHVGGDIVRALIEPQLFTARPGGGWAPRLVEPGSVVESADLTEVSFSLRSGARWSDGSEIDSADLRRTMDQRVVAGVSESGRRITVRFKQPLPGWRRLWSGIDSISRPADHLSGGPFKVEEVVVGLETVLVPNDRWWGVEAGEGPWLDELRLVVVPDQTTLLQLFERGELDVVAPWAVPGLQAYVCEESSTCSFAVDAGGGWQAMVLLNADVVGRDARRSVLTGFAPDEFVGALLRGESRALGFESLEPRELDDLSLALSLSVAEDIPMLAAIARAVQIQADDDGGVVPELRAGPSRLVAEWAAVSDYEVLIAETYLGPSPC
ncbi:MAG: ABC transporter substrate-binding protein, partial [Actinomycetota bacterium]|nr:ABC transporter substrate-binding protein [Actinomycetota bacterium]